MDAFDLPSLFGFRDRLRQVAAQTEPFLDLLVPPPPGTRLAVLSGSFNPPTSAHAHWTERALSGGFDAVLLLLPIAPAGKPASGLIPEDRLAALHLMRPPLAGIAITNVPLYADQAVAVRSALDYDDVAFLAGSDKLHQLLDATWYDDRDAALKQFFDNASMIVGPRGETIDDVRGLLALPENDQFVDRVALMALHPAIGDLSSTRVRGLLAAGSDPSGLLPPPVAQFCEQICAFAPPGPDECLGSYATRVKMLDMLWDANAGSADFASLVHLSRAATSAGRKLREAVLHGDAGILLKAAKT